MATHQSEKDGHQHLVGSGEKRHRAPSLFFLLEMNAKQNSHERSLVSSREFAMTATTPQGPKALPRPRAVVPTPNKRSVDNKMLSKLTRDVSYRLGAPLAAALKAGSAASTSFLGVGPIFQNDSGSPATTTQARYASSHAENTNQFIKEALVGG